MPLRKPERLPVSSIDEMIGSNFQVHGIRPHVTRDLAIFHGEYNQSAIRSFLKPSIPYRVDDFRIVLIAKGDFEVTANLRKYHIASGTLGIMRNGGIIQLDSIAADATIYGILVKEEFLRLALGGRMPSVFKVSQLSNYVPVSDEECSMLEAMFKVLHQLVARQDYSRDTVAALVAAITSYTDNLFEQHGTSQPASVPRGQRVMEHFIDLVNEHSAQHHTLDFYADRLCITPRYLGTLVRQSSGTTAKEWIDRAIINEAKVALKHSDITIAQLADTLNFPNASFFCRFFKRMTGLTPVAYRAL